MSGNPFNDVLENQFRAERVRVETDGTVYEGWARMWHFNDMRVVLTDAVRDGEIDVPEVMVREPDTVERLNGERTIEEVDPSALDPSPYTQRDFDTRDFKKYVQDVRGFGHIAKPPLVRPHPSADEGYEIVSGHKRVRAALEAGLDSIAVEVEDLDRWETTEIFVDEHFPITKGGFEAAKTPGSGRYGPEEIEAVLEELQEDFDESTLKSNTTLEWYLNTEPHLEDEEESADGEEPEAEDAEEGA